MGALPYEQKFCVASTAYPNELHDIEEVSFQVNEYYKGAGPPDDLRHDRPGLTSAQRGNQLRPLPVPLKHTRRKSLLEQWVPHPGSPGPVGRRWLGHTTDG